MRSLTKLCEQGAKEERAERVERVERVERAVRAEREAKVSDIIWGIFLFLGIDLVPSAHSLPCVSAIYHRRHE
jgi:hypothetical protein